MKFNRKTLFALPALCLMLLLPLAAESHAGDDSLLRSLQTEMARSKARLHLDNTSTPYFIDYRVLDADVWEADVALGALRADTHARIRFLLVQVRLGDYKQDSSWGRGEGAVEVFPIDGDDQSFRFQVWSATDKAYKQAVEALTEKQARLKQLTIDHPVDDFAHADPVESIGPVAHLTADREPWLRALREATALYRNDPKIEMMQGSLTFETINRYYVNSEGTAVRSGQELYHGVVYGSTQAEDGMRIERSAGWASNQVSDIPKPAEFLKTASELYATLGKLREAPLADEDYHGPVLLSSDAATTVFSALVGNHVVGLKPELGQNARVRGQFASSYKVRVLPEFLSVVDDPTLATLNGKPLLGHYEVDDEGVKASAVTVIDKGVLVNYLVGRQPIRDFPASNGHGRARLPLAWPAPAVGNLIVKPSTTSTPAELRQKLIDMCRERGLEYGYRVETLAGPSLPRLLYRVWVKDGHEELVRGAVIGDLDQRSLRSNVVAAGNDPEVDSHLEPVPQSIVAPSILFDDLEVKRQTAGKDKLPEYPAPGAVAATTAKDSKDTKK